MPTCSGSVARRWVAIVLASLVVSQATAARGQSRRVYQTTYVQVVVPEHLEVGGQTFEASFGGYSAYLESIRYRRPELFAALEPELNGVLTRRAGAWILYVASAAVGTGLLLAPLLGGIDEDTDLTPMWVGLTVMGVGLLAFLLLLPGRGSLLDLIDAHNLASPESPMALRLGDSRTGAPPVASSPASPPPAPTPPRVARPPARPLAPGPTEVAGFLLLATQEEVRTTCETAGGALTDSATTDGRFDTRRCSVLPVTIEHITQGPMLALCGDRLCGVLLAITPSADADEAWMGAVRAIGRVIVARYGPLRPRFRGPDECRADFDAGFLARFRSGQCSFAATVAVTGGDVRLSLSGGDTGLSATLQYRTDAMLERMRSGAPPAERLRGGEHL